MPHVRATAGHNNIEIDDGVVLEPDSFVNFNTERPLVKAAIEAGTVEVLDAVAAPPPLGAENLLVFFAHNVEQAEALLQKEQFCLVLNPKEGETKLIIVSKDSGGHVRKDEIALS